MPIIDPEFRQQLNPTTANEVDNLITRLRRAESRLQDGQAVPAGEWTDIEFAASRFAVFPANGVNAWTVAGANVVNLSYMTVGKSYLINFSIENTTVAGAPVALIIILPTPIFGPAGDRKESSFGYLDNATPGSGVARGNINNINLLKDLGGTAWAAAAGTTSVSGQLWIRNR